MKLHFKFGKADHVLGCDYDRNFLFVTLVIFKFEQCASETVCLLRGLHCCHINHSIHEN